MHANPSYNDVDRTAVYEGLMEFAREPRFKPARREAQEHIIGLQDLADEVQQVLQVSEIALFNLSAFLALHQQVGGNQILAELFLEERHDRLTEAERRFLGDLLQARPSLYEIVALVPGDSLTLKDRRTGEICEVSEQHWSTELEPGALLAAQVLNRGGDVGFVEGLQIPFPGDLAEPLTLQLGDLLSAVHAEHPDWREPARRLVLRLHQMWFFEVVLPTLEARYADPTQEGAPEMSPFVGGHEAKRPHLTLLRDDGSE